MTVVGMAGIGGVVAASAAIETASAVMQAAETAAAVVTQAVTPPSSDPGSATAAAQMATATATMTAYSRVAFAELTTLGGIMRTSALQHAGADSAGAAVVSALV